MNIVLTPELESFVSGEVESGRYTSAIEVVREALHLLEEQDAARTRELHVFNEELARRLEDLDRGETVDPSQVLARLRERSEQSRSMRA